MLEYFIVFFVALTLSAVTFFIFLKRKPHSAKHKLESHHIHKDPVPRWGGVIIYALFVFLVLIFLPISKPLLGLIFGSLILVIGGIIDDHKDLAPSRQLIFQIVAILTVIGFGIDVEYINNPFGEFVYLNSIQFPLVTLWGSELTFTLFSDLFTFFWLLIIINTINWLDGIDGAAGGVSLIGALAIFAICLLPHVNQPELASLSLILAGLVLGFLIFNFHPSKIMLGTAGSTFLGFTLGLLAIISGGKLATALLILGFPILDFITVICFRIKNKKPIWKSDQNHFHHRLLRKGYSQPKITLFIYLLSLALAFVAISGNIYFKTIALFLLIVIGIFVIRYSFKEQNKEAL